MEKRELDVETVKQIAGYMRIGADFYLATAAVGITEEQAADWLFLAAQAKKNKQNNVYLELFEATRAAKAFAEVIALQRLSAEGGASGAKWLLEKINPDKYGKGLRHPQPDKGKTKKPKRPEEPEEWEKMLDGI